MAVLKRLGVLWGVLWIVPAISGCGEPPEETGEVTSALTYPNCVVDGKKNNTETGTDCGGGDCPACATGQGCAVSGDCLSLVCIGQKCAKVTCTDATRNGSETDVDCGGSCAIKCLDGNTCAIGADCVSKVCTGGVCTSSCTDGVRNGVETYVDCGGGTCPGCAKGYACRVGADCVTGVCGATGYCLSPACNDGVKNGTETDVDCGGTCATKCADAKGCATSADCANKVCTDWVCATPTTVTCGDGAKNGAETDLDCGGGLCFGCGQNKRCAVNGDCRSGLCTKTYCVVPPSCRDGVQNATETGVDCGGKCNPCGDGVACLSGTDCASTLCVNNLCAQPGCGDGIRNGAESGIDCGGGNCPACAAGQACKVATDCASGTTCTGGYCVALVNRCIGVVCQAVDACHLAGGCDPTTGLCTNPLAPNGTTCTDNDACTRIDSCQSGVCQGDDPVVCAALDTCHVAGVCSPMTGVCSNPNASDGTLCSIPNATASCTSGTCGIDQCQSGYSAIGGVCINDDECTTGAAMCDANAECADLPGSFTCTCDEGYVGDGHSCMPIVPVYTIVAAPSGLGVGVSSGGSFSLEGMIAAPGPRVASSGGTFSVEPLLPASP